MTHFKKGRLITFEGVEGGGKSSNIATVCSVLADHNIDCVVTREPGGTPLAEEIREIVLKKRTETVDDKTELLLIFAARAQHFNGLIKPALAEGKWVLCDRFTDATYAYQGAGRCMDFSIIAQLETLVQGDVRPDLTLLFDLDVQTGLQRAKSRGALDRFEQQTIEFFERIRNFYLQRAKTQSYYRIINAAEPLETVQLTVKQATEAFIAQQKVLE